MDNQQPNTEKECKACGVSKPLENFPIYHRKGYRRGQCSECWSAYHKRWRDGEIIPQVKSDVRVCRICKEEKPIGDFSKVYAKSQRGKDYRSHRCSECDNVLAAEKMRRLRKSDPEKYRSHQRNHRKRNLEKVRAQRRESGRRLKGEVFAAYGGYKCSCPGCSETCPSMLTLDHINNDGNKHRSTLNGGRGRKASVDMYRRLKDAGYPKDIQVLCYNCNLSKHRMGGSCEHVLLMKGSETRRKP